MAHGLSVFRLGLLKRAEPVKIPVCDGKQGPLRLVRFKQLYHGQRDK